MLFIIYFFSYRSEGKLICFCNLQMSHLLSITQSGMPAPLAKSSPSAPTQQNLLWGINFYPRKQAAADGPTTEDFLRPTYQRLCGLIKDIKASGPKENPSIWLKKLLYFKIIIHLYHDKTHHNRFSCSLCQITSQLRQETFHDHNLLEGGGILDTVNKI